jgi:hypothetical protein
VRIVDIGIDNDGIDPIEKLEVVYLVCNWNLFSCCLLSRPIMKSSLELSHTRQWSSVGLETCVPC